MPCFSSLRWFQDRTDRDEPNLMGLGIGRWARACAFAVALLSLAPPTLAQELDPCVDVALVLAVDGSGSVDNGEYQFQQQAIARSFRDPEVLAALRRRG